MKKNKIILTLLLGIIFLTPALVLQAEVTTNTVVVTQTQKITDPTLKKAGEDMIKTVLDKQAEVKKDVEVRKIEIEKKIANNTEKKILLEIKKQEKVKTTLEKVFNNLYNKLIKLEEVDAKMSAMIKTNEDAGKDVSSLKIEYNIAKIALEKAKGEIFETRTITIEQIKVATSKSVLRDLVKTSEDKIKAVGVEYRKILPILAQMDGNNSIKN